MERLRNEMEATWRDMRRGRKWTANARRRIFSILMNNTAIYSCMFVITLITFHSGATYLYNNRQLIANLFKNED